MSNFSSVLLIVCAIMLGTRLSSFFDRQGVSKRDQIGLVVIMFSLLLMAAFTVPNLFSMLTFMFR